MNHSRLVRNGARALSLSCAVFVTACGSQHGSTAALPGLPAAATPAPPSASVPSLAVRVMTGNGLTSMSAVARRDARQAYRSVSAGRRTLSVSIQSVVVTGTVFPSYAGVQAVTASSTQNTTSVPSSVNLAFTNLPVGNNEWVVVDVVGYDQQNGTGSHIDLGQLAGLVNVSASNASASIDGGSTLRLQAGLSAMLQGIISSYDLKNETTLDAHLGSLVSGAQADPVTGLFTNAQLASFMSTLYQSYNRSITLSGGQPPSLATVVYNHSDANEKSFAYNAIQTNNLNSAFAQQGSSQPSVGAVGLTVVGSPFTGVIEPNLHPPSTVPAPAAVQVRAEGISAPTGSVQIQHVYGGALFVGLRGTSAAALAAGAFTGGVQAIAGRPPADSSTVAVPVAASQATMIMNDPQAAAFISVPYYQLTPTTANTYILACNYAAAQDCVYGTGRVTNVSGSNVTVAFDTFNPFGLTTSQLQVCTGLDCFPLSNGSTGPVRYPFYDGGNSLSFYAWTPVSGSAVTGISQPVTGGYAVDYSGSTSGAFQSTTPAYFYPHQDVQILSDAPVGTVWTATMTCSGQVLQNTGVQQNGYADVYVMNVAPNFAQCSPIQFSFTLPGGTDGSGSSGTITISSLGVPPIGRR